MWVSRRGVNLGCIDIITCSKNTGCEEHLEVAGLMSHFLILGESNVYTLGNMGAHRIVCTKLPTVGHTREAMTAAGNTTTRLLGELKRLNTISMSKTPASSCTIWNCDF